MRLCSAVACWVLLGFLPLTVSALGLGDISLDSALNEPFSAEVSLDSVGATKLDQINVALASRDTFDRYGLDKPAFLTEFSFSVEQNAQGQPVIRIVSNSPVSEPFVTLLLDVKWGSGRLLREYTVLLDPPVFEEAVVDSVTSPAQTVAPVEPVPAEPVADPVADIVAEETAPEAFIAAEPQAPVIQEEAFVELEAEQPPVNNEPQSEPESLAAQAELAQPAPVVAESSSETLSGDYTTQKGDTLWSIASSARGDQGLTTNQMMLAIYRSNPEAFLGNINGLKAGAILRLPSAEEAEGLSASEATQQAKQQHSAWSGDISRGQSVAAETEGQLQLVAPDESEFAGDQQGAVSDDPELTGGSGIPEAELDESQRLIEVEDAELQALQQRTAELEQQPLEDDGGAETALEIEEIGEPVEGGDTSILVEEIDEPLDSPFAEDAESLQDDSLLAEDGQEELLTAPVDEPVASDVVELSDSADDGSSMLGGLLGSYWVWGAGGLIVLVLLFLARRRAGTDEDDAEATGTWDTDDDGVAHDQTIKDFSDLPSFDESIVVDEVDEALAEDAAGPAPIKEPEAEPEPEPIFDAAAEDSVRDALEDEPIDFDADQDETEPEQTLDGIEDIVEASDSTAGLEQLDVADALAGGDDEDELPLEKTISTGAPLNLDQADPIAEAEFHMAYGLYDQAADLLARALDDQPDNREYRVKLIEVYFVWENKEGFLAQATALHESISDAGDADWNKVLILGKQLCPDSELFAGSSASAPSADAMDLELGEDTGEMDLDFSLGGTELQALDESALADSGESVDGLDFDLGGESDSSGEDGLSLDLGGDDSSSGLDMDFADESLGFGDDDALLPDSEQTMKLDEEDLAVTIESDTVDSLGANAPTVEADMGGATMESPTLENPMVDLASDAATLDIDLDSSDAAATMESPTLEIPDSSSETSEMPALDETAIEGSGLDDLNLDDAGLDDPTSLDVDLSGLADLPEDNDPSLPDIDSTLNQLDNTGELLAPEDVADMSRTIADDDATMLAKTGEMPGLEAEYESAVASDTLQQPKLEAGADGDTAEQPEISLDGLTDAADPGDLPEDATMTEVGTKLDLARAYIDMGDPDGARSILKEVLDEGGEPQQQEARQLLEEIGG